MLRLNLELPSLQTRELNSHFALAGAKLAALQSTLSINPTTTIIQNTNCFGLRILSNSSPLFLVLTDNPMNSNKNSVKSKTAF